MAALQFCRATSVSVAVAALLLLGLRSRESVDAPTRSRGLAVASVAGARSVNNRTRAEELRATYFSRPTRAGEDAVDEAVDFLVGQHDLGAAVERAPDSSSRPLRTYDDGPRGAGGALPPCRVTHDRIIDEGTFVARRGAPRYDARCFAVKSRYHDAPTCGRDETRPPIHAWAFSLQSAVDGRCRMPDPAPTRAAAAFFAGRGERKRKTLTVLMLGLSFMGQPFASLACLNQKTLSLDGSKIFGVRRTKDSKEEPADVAYVVEDGGACTGAARDDIAAYYPAATHGPDFQIPTQHPYFCNHLGRSLFEYEESGYPRVRVCYQYMFNMKKNLRQNAPVACDLDWADVDVVLHLFPNDHFKDEYLKKTNAPKDVRAVFVSVIGIYEGTLKSQLRAAYARDGYDPPDRKDMQPRPRSCDQTDIHYEMPGFTDHAADAWYALIATGLANATAAKKTNFVGCMGEPVKGVCPGKKR